MLSGVLGKKLGMAQIFSPDGKVIPVTVVDVGTWYVTQIKTPEKDGYSAIQIGLPRKRYQGSAFSPEWLKKKSDFFLHIKEVKSVDQSHAFELGQQITLENVALQEGEYVAVTGTSTGIGFQGSVKRWGFAGGPKTHGSKLHRRPGSSGFLRRQGEIMKGKKFPGHCGHDQVTVSGLNVAKIDKNAGCLFIKGALPGKKDSLVIIRKQGV
ncbi:MAG: 50S ribosomal protein L3 [candidate division TM6 bacterium GW2011_GWF2_38_10]|nr:MAG: 50S ribosomal protein L3 [candidate division TM6 bacterium GW2011_GWF2_38_10]